jgi:hypothetical protein
VRTARALLLTLLTSGCASPPHLLQPRPTREWPVVRDSAQRASAAGRFDAADLALADFARRYASAAEGREALYWRALMRLDPAHPSGPASAVPAFDAYLASGGVLPHREEALALRRLAARLDALGAIRDRSAATGASLERADASREEELKKVRQELKATQEELERIKRRLSTPKP